MEEVDPVPPPASAYAEEPPPPLDLEPPPPPFAPAAPTYESYVVEEPAPPFADGIDVPNVPPELATVAPAVVITKRPNWIMRHKLVAATTAVVSAVIVAAAVNSTGDPGTPTIAPTSSAGIQLSPSGGGSTDQEVPVGTAATIGGMQATVTAANFQQTLDENRIDGYLVVDVAYANTAGQNKPYNSLDWKIRSPTGRRRQRVDRHRRSARRGRPRCGRHHRREARVQGGGREGRVRDPLEARSGRPVAGGLEGTGRVTQRRDRERGPFVPTP